MRNEDDEDFEPEEELIDDEPIATVVTRLQNDLKKVIRALVDEGFIEEENLETSIDE